MSAVSSTQSTRAISVVAPLVHLVVFFHLALDVGLIRRVVGRRFGDGWRLWRRRRGCSLGGCALRRAPFFGALGRVFCVLAALIDGLMQIGRSLLLGGCALCEQLLHGVVHALL